MERALRWNTSKCQLCHRIIWQGHQGNSWCKRLRLWKRGSKLCKFTKDKCRKNYGESKVLEYERSAIKLLRVPKIEHQTQYHGIALVCKVRVLKNENSNHLEGFFSRDNGSRFCSTKSQIQCHHKGVHTIFILEKPVLTVFNKKRWIRR